MSENSTVLVTGASGFIGMHCILQLLEQGYQVKGTVRSAAKAEKLRQTLRPHSQHTHNLIFAEADLTSDAGWAEAMAGCNFVLHVASPLPTAEPKDENELIRPAVEGTRRVLQAAHQAGVRRVVQTSSVAAIVHGHEQEKVYDETDWTNLANPVAAYPKSKTLAEKAAWEFVNQPEVTLELATINPSYVLGPVLDAQKTSASAEVVLTILQRKYPGVPRLNFAVVDVRDVAAAHLAAMITPEAAGKRFICSSENIWMRDMAQAINAKLGPQGHKVNTRKLPDFLLRLVALFDPKVAMVVDNLGKVRQLSNQQIKAVLHWQPRPAKEAVVAMAQSFIDLNAL
ncbi:MAG: aldehyde reductase [Candidatus Promineifilaceae bacterium]